MDGSSTSSSTTATTPTPSRSKRAVTPSSHYADYDGGDDAEDDNFEDASSSSSTTPKKRRQITDAEKVFKCEEPGCGKSYASKSGLSVHIRKHREDTERVQTAKHAAEEKVARDARRAQWAELGSKNFPALLDMMEGMHAKIDALAQQEKKVEQDLEKKKTADKASAVSDAEKLRKLVPKTLGTQMVYTNSGLKYKSKNVSADFPCSADTFQALMAPLGAGAARRELSNDDFLAVFTHEPTKSLRYGGQLQLNFPVKISLTSAHTLHVASSYSMC
eukprot:TRINITY_DN16912_c0_g1_i2.p1 TRINITY_DN16912_c0_g1~~TRINITY_DN16912_c0_g1_i2.p1  ORF type:complete len:275 (-),score=81.59 TRINITY_DN16912_c0_g1_i2:7-831(-)